MHGRGIAEVLLAELGGEDPFLRCDEDDVAGDQDRNEQRDTQGRLNASAIPARMDMPPR